MKALTVVLAIGLAAPLASDAQQAGRVYRIGTLTTASREPAAPYITALEEGLRERGYVQNQNVAFEHRYADFKPDRFPDLAAELVRLKVDVIVAPSNPATAAAKRATASLPIVMVLAGQPVEEGLVASLARPGGNVTGLTRDVTPETTGKRVQLLKELVPALSRLAVLRGPAPTTPPYWRAAEDAARALGVTLRLVEVEAPGDFARAFGAIARERPNGLYVWTHALTIAHRADIVAFAVKNRLPAMYEAREFVEAGGLMAYGADLRDLYRRAATHVDKILKGTRPADLPVEQPTRFELVINTTTAKALGLTIPQSLLFRVDHVIR